jgi:ABC-type proline/glycine betaine transport system permease subunit
VNTKTTAGRKTKMENKIIEFILDITRGFLELVSYILKFLTMVVIAWGVSLILPLSCFQAGMLLMIFWFLNLYNISR